jgi:hypothetical protein
VREDPVRKGLLFAGTENSVWVSFDDGDHWQSLQLNLPHTSMRDLWIHENDLIVATHGRGFWILDDIAPLREVAADYANSVHLFTPAAAYRIQRDTNTDTPIPPDEPMASNPPQGAIIDYFLPSAVSSVKIDILDAQNKVIRSFSNTDKPDITQEELQKQLVPMYWTRPQRTLSTEGGMHRWTWPLHYSAPSSSRHEYPIAAIPHGTPRSPLGPTAVPGKYTVRLTVEGKILTAPLIVKMDPRVNVSGTELEKKLQAEIKLASMMNQTHEAVSEATSLRAQLAKVNESSNQTLKGAVSKFEKDLTDIVGAPAGFFAPPSAQITLNRVNANAGTLYQQVWQVDAAPTSSQEEAFSRTQQESAEILKRWSEFKDRQLPELNRLLREGHASEVSPQSNFHQDEIDVDEE